MGVILHTLCLFSNGRPISWTPRIRANDNFSIQLRYLMPIIAPWLNRACPIFRNSWTDASEIRKSVALGQAHRQLDGFQHANLAGDAFAGDIESGAMVHRSADEG